MNGPGDLDRVRDDGDIGEPREFLGEYRGRRPGVHEDRLVRMDQAGRLAGDVPLGGDLAVLAVVEGGLGLDLRQQRAAVDPVDQALVLKIDQIAANRLARDIQHRGQIGRTDLAVRLQHLHDVPVAFLDPHGVS